jgi:hypothetical protein
VRAKPTITPRTNVKAFAEKPAQTSTICSTDIAGLHAFDYLGEFHAPTHQRADRVGGLFVE